MATTPTSYLQTLPNDKASDFVAVLQQVHEHLNQEIQWLNEQVQQKTSHLQGIETLLSEAAALGIVPSHASSPAPSEAVAATPPSSDATETTGNGNQAVSSSTLESAASTEAISSPTAIASPVASFSTSEKEDLKKPEKSARTGRKPKQAATTKTTAAKAKPAKAVPSPSSPSPTSKRSKSTQSSPQQPILRSQFRDKQALDAVGEILGKSKRPLDADEVLEQLYEQLPDADYKRIKHSISNVLSQGKSKKRWRSTGRGLYAI